MTDRGFVIDRGIRFRPRTLTPAGLRGRVDNAERIANDEKQRADENGVLARIDAVMGIPNRRAFDEYLLRAYASNLRHSRGLAIVMIDIDLFKYVNDSYGHKRGDNVLRSIGEIIRRNIRTEDFLARWGGDELAIVMENGDLTEEAIKESFSIRLSKINAEINQFIDDNEMEWPGCEVDGVNTHLSVGLASVRKDELSQEELIEKADNEARLDKQRRKMERVRD